MSVSYLRVHNRGQRQSCAEKFRAWKHCCRRRSREGGVTVRSIGTEHGSLRPITRAFIGAWPALTRYAAAVAIVGVSIAASLWLRPQSYTTPFLFFFPTVIIAAWIGGLRAGLLCTAIATLFVNHYLLSPYGHLSLDFASVLRTLFFAIGLGFICYGADNIRRRRDSVIDTQAELLEMSFDPVIMRDSESRITYWNNGAERLYGWGQSEAVGKVSHELLRTVFPRPLGEILDLLQRTGRWEGELVHTRKDGTEVIVASRWTEKAHSAKGTAVLEVNYDLTELKKTKSSLQSMEERAEMAADAAGLGYWDWDLIKNERVWSLKCKQLFGLAPDSSVEYPIFLNAVHPEDRARTDAAVKAALERNEVYDVEFRVVWPDGSSHWIASWGRVFFDPAGTPARLSGVAQDVTARRQVEEALRLSEKIAAVGRMAGVLAHEINNPLDAVKNLVYLFGQTPGMDDATRDYVRLMDGEVARIQNIVANTLSFYRDSSAPVPVKLNEVLDSVLHLYARKIERKHVTVETRIECTVPVYGYPGELRQVFSNLVANAVDAIGTNGRLKLHVYASTNWTNHRVRGLRVVVADDGHGIAPDARAKLFEPFFTTKGEQGTGLGLWLAQGIVRKHQGFMRLHSSTRVGRTGTCFSVFFPTEQALDEDAAALAAHATGTR
jgi:PAS domain S-box-containing protein